MPTKIIQPAYLPIAHVHPPAGSNDPLTRTHHNLCRPQHRLTQLPPLPPQLPPPCSSRPLRRRQRPGEPTPLSGSLRHLLLQLQYSWRQWRLQPWPLSWGGSLLLCHHLLLLLLLGMLVLRVALVTRRLRVL